MKQACTCDFHGRYGNYEMIGRNENVGASEMEHSVKALLFDVFGTVVDWRTGIIREGEEFGRANRISRVDWTAFADDWRGLYQPAMQRVRSGEIAWKSLDKLHRESLDRLLADRGTGGIAEAALDHFNRAWHRLDPWPDAVSGLTRMKQKYIIATCSNGNVALMLNLAKYGGLPWDMVLGAELARQYKPRPEVYEASVGLLGLEPADCVMVAAHDGDLEAAAKCGLKSAFIPRPREFGSAGKPQITPSREWNFVAEDLEALAQQLEC
jgi:2-haloacid dehalogenase